MTDAATAAPIADSRDRYADVNREWPDPMPAITRDEARRAAMKLARAFKCPAAARVRKCWIALRPPFGELRRGWRRLVHDVSHRVFRARCPSKRPHDPRHARFEREVKAYVLDHGWLDGRLRSADPVKPDASEKRAAKLANVQARIKRWESKRKRAETALAKLRRSERRLASLTP